MTNTRLHKLRQASKLKQLYKATSLFAIALVLGVTSLTALINPNAMAYPGELDHSFHTNLGSGFNNLLMVNAVQPDGKIIVGGLFTTFNGNVQNRLIRLNPDGSKDNAFSVDSNSTIQTINTQSDGGILIGGNFTTFNGNTQNRLIRLNPDGSKDTSFDIGSGFDLTLATSTLFVGNKFIIGGNFISYNGTPVGRIARLHLTNDKDKDGVIDTQEDSTANSGDANNDGP